MDGAQKLQTTIISDVVNKSEFVRVVLVTIKDSYILKISKLVSIILTSNILRFPTWIIDIQFFHVDTHSTLSIPKNKLFALEIDNLHSVLVDPVLHSV